MKKSKIFMIICICVLFVSIIGSTIAYYSKELFASTANTITHGLHYYINYSKGQNITGATLVRVSSYEDSEANTDIIFNKKDDTYEIYGHIYIDVNEIGDNLSASSALKYTIVNNDTVISEGTFKGSKSTDSILAASDIKLETTEQTYTVYIWIDEDEKISVDAENEALSLTVRCEATMIPINTVNAVTFISSLYENASKTQVTNNDINYNYAPSVSLMNDGFGQGLLNVWESAGITTSEECYEYLSYENIMNETGCTNEDECEAILSLVLKEIGVPSVDALCESSPMNGNIRYYGANPNNYIDIGDVYEEDIVINYFEKNKDYFSSVGITTSQECYTFFSAANLISLGACKDTRSCEIVRMQAIAETFGVFTVDEVCGIMNISAGTTKALYRIIGVFKDVELADGTKKDLIKVVREVPIGEYSWDTSASTVNKGYGINQWGESGEYTGADLMKLMNPNYSENTDTICDYDMNTDKTSCDNQRTGLINNSLWWNSGSGMCYVYSSNGALACNFTNNGLSSNVHDKIEEVVWNTGGHDDYDIFVNEMYIYERGINLVEVGTTCSGDYCNDTVVRTPTWTGKVALAYPSDYGYATDFKSCDSNLYNYSAEECYINDWLYKGFNQMFLTPYSYGTPASFGASNIGNIGTALVASPYTVSPTFYLNSELGIVKGDGTKDNPYVVQ